MRTEYAAPTGLKFALVLFYKYAAPTALKMADRKVWPDATGAKGQRPTHGRAGAGLASPAGSGGRRSPDCDGAEPLFFTGRQLIGGCTFRRAATLRQPH